MLSLSPRTGEAGAGNSEAVLIRWRRGADCEAATLLLQGKIAVIFGHVAEPEVRGLAESEVPTAAERARAARYLREADRLQSLAARGFLRSTLALLYGVAPGAVVFGGRRFEKPRVAEPGDGRVDVSLSHAGGWAVCAMAHDIDLGVDVEPDRVDAPFDVVALARHVFTSEEREALGAFAEEGARRAAFFDIWRRKEAVLKAAGLGFGGAPKGVAVAGGTQGGVLMPHPQSEAGGRTWQVRVLRAPAGPEIALAFTPRRGRGDRIS